MIDCQAALDRALDALLAHDPSLHALLAVSGRPPLRKRDPGFEGLAMIIVGQQVSVASAAAIWARVKNRFDPLHPQAILAATDDDLRGCGLSSPKIRTMRAAADAAASGAVPLDSLPDLPADEAHARLVTVKGIGPWTADIYLLFCLGHPDAFPAGDLALQEAVRMGYGLEARPDAAGLTAFAERWRPWRGAAAKLLWAYYGAARRRGDAMPLAQRNTPVPVSEPPATRRRRR
jgi:DNA-3-methyladenine glycosylase II